MKILIISDAWVPQINGVVRTLQATEQELTRQGHKVCIIGPDATRPLTFALPSYPEIKVEFGAGQRILDIITAEKPDAIHIATEGPLGWTAWSLCQKHKTPFTTSYHTAFPEYLAKRVPAFLSPLTLHLGYRLLRHFHSKAEAVLVATKSIRDILISHNFAPHKLKFWSRGVDTHLFKPTDAPVAAYTNLPRPILLNVGRVAVEKNLEAFLNIATTGSKIVIGDGPDLEMLKAKYPDTHFLGSLTGKALAQHYADADLFVFPSTTDTFGLVLLEACACGLPIAAYPAPGPLDLFTSSNSKDFAVLDKDLQKAIDTALQLPNATKAARPFAEKFSWQACTKDFIAHITTKN